MDPLRHEPRTLREFVEADLRRAARLIIKFQDEIAPVPKEWLVTDTVLDGTGEPIPGRHPLDGTDLEIAYTLLGDDLVLRVNKAARENAAKAMTAHGRLELKAERADLVVPVGTRGRAARDVGYRLGRVAGKLLKATRERMGKS